MEGKRCGMRLFVFFMSYSPFSREQNDDITIASCVVRHEQSGFDGKIFHLNDTVSMIFITFKYLMNEEAKATNIPFSAPALRRCFINHAEKKNDQSGEFDPCCIHKNMMFGLKINHGLHLGLNLSVRGIEL